MGDGAHTLGGLPPHPRLSHISRVGALRHVPRLGGGCARDGHRRLTQTEQKDELTRPGGMHQVKYWGGGLKEEE